MHLRNGEKPCHYCQERYNRYYKEARRNKVEDFYDNSSELVCEHTTKRKPQGVRGTPAGYVRHKKAGQDPCQECLGAYRKESLERYYRNAEMDRPRKLAYQAEYRRTKKEQIKRSDALYYQINKEMYRINEYRRRQRKKINYDGWKAEDITKTHGTTCYLCQHPVDLAEDPITKSGPHVEHVVPLYHPDTPGNVLSNVRWSHNQCNLRKGTKLVEELDLPFDPPEGVKNAIENREQKPAGTQGIGDRP